MMRTKPTELHTLDTDSHKLHYAQKEVILSAGTFASPLLLMKSGIGPENILNAAGVRSFFV